MFVIIFTIFLTKIFIDYIITFNEGREKKYKGFI